MQLIIRDLIYRSPLKIMKDEQTTCTPCEQNFERKVNELVKEGEAPDTKQRAKKEAEVKAAFDEHGKSEK